MTAIHKLAARAVLYAAVPLVIDRECEAGLTRIIIPTVYRDDYISALKAMSSNAHSGPLVRMLARAARFSRWLDMSSKVKAFEALKNSNALERPEAVKLSFDDSLIRVETQDSH